MQSLAQMIRAQQPLGCVGFDDAPFELEATEVNLAAVVCSNTRFEGMLYNQIEKDGNDATDTMIQMLKGSQFFDQINVVLTDGIAVGGFNVIDLPKLAQSLDKPCIAVMRHLPDMVAIDLALQNFVDYSQKKFTILSAGEIFSSGPFYYQVQGCGNKTAAVALHQLSDRAHVPEALRLAHLITSAVKTGSSFNNSAGFKLP